MIRTAIKTPEEGGYCWFCGKEVGEDSYCFGCGEYVCIDCDLNLDLYGRHEVEDHQPFEEDEEEEDEDIEEY
jgi:hypothetical protein